MTAQMEDRVREVLADRSDDVVRPSGWEERVLDAGHRRLARRRIGAVACAVAAVLAVLLVGGTMVPGALSGVQPLHPGPNSGVLDPSDLPVGPRTTAAYATVESAGSSIATLHRGDRRWPLEQAMADSIVSVPGGVVASERWDDGWLAFHPDRGATKILYRGESGFAASADGTRGAWFKGFKTLELVALPSGRVIASRPLKKGDLPQSEFASVSAILGDKVLVTSGDSDWAYVWDPKTGKLTPLLGNAGGRVDLLGVSQARDTVLLYDGKRCVRNVSLSHPDRPARWKRCDFGRNPPLTSLSPDGRSLAMHEPDGRTLSVRDVATGDLRWSRTLDGGIDWADSFAERWIVRGLRIGRVEWESADQVLLTYGTARDMDGEIGDLLRCGARQPTCERVPTADGNPVTTVGRKFVR